MRKISSRLVLTLGFLSCIFSPVNASAEDGKSLCSKPILVAASSIGRSMMVSADQKVTGITPEIFNTITRETGCVFEYVVVPRARAFLMLKRGEVDIVADATRSPDRDESAYFLEAGRIAPALVSLKTKRPSANTIKELLDGKATLIHINGFYFGPEVDAIIDDPRMAGRVSRAPSPELAARMLLAGRADAVICHAITLLEAWDTWGNGEELVATQLDGMPTITFGTYMSTTRMSPSDRQVFENAMDAVTLRGEVQKLVRKYYPAWVWPTLRFSMPKKK